MPRKLIYVAVIVTILCTALGLVLVVAAGLTQQQLQRTWWDRPAMSVGIVLLFPTMFIGNVMEYLGGPAAADSLLVLILPIQFVWYVALFWLGWRILHRNQARGETSEND